jgi:hypothetical protein
MNRIQRNDQVAEELKHIPAGSDDQNILRAGYHNIRRRDLSRNSEATPTNTLLRVLETVRRKNTDFHPTYDKGFFIQ